MARTAIVNVARDAEHVPALDLTRGPTLSVVDVATVRAALFETAPACSLVALDAGEGRRRCYVREGECMVSVASADLSEVNAAVESVRWLARECREAETSS